MSKKPLTPETAPLGAPPILPQPQDSLQHVASSVFEKILGGSQTLTANQARIQQNINRRIYKQSRGNKRDYTHAYAMIETQPAQSQSTQTTPSLPTAFIRNSPLVQKAESTQEHLSHLLQETASTTLIGHTAAGNAMFDIEFQDSILGGLRCTITHEPQGITAVFHVQTKQQATSLENRIDQLRDQFNKKGISLADLQIKLV